MAPTPLSTTALLLTLPQLIATSSAFVAPRPYKTAASLVIVRGKLDDLTKDLYAPDNNPDIEKDDREATKLDKDKVDRYGVGDWSGYVDFDEFDGGDGQMGVAGDGNKKLEKFGSEVQLQLAKSKVMSAKNAWGRSTGYAESLIEQGVEATRAQQIENWHNQQEVLQQKKQARYMTDEFDQIKTSNKDENWRDLASFGVERNQEFDLDETFGAVQVGDAMEGTLEFHKARMNGPAVIQELAIKNPFMGFADFRAALTADSAAGFEVTPTEGSLSAREATNFIVKYKAQAPGTAEGYLVIETEDMKKTWKLIGSTA